MTAERLFPRAQSHDDEDRLAKVEHCPTNANPPHILNMQANCPYEQSSSHLQSLWYKLVAIECDLTVSTLRLKIFFRI
jgi:hypothetical protein